ncbi:MAG: hypothetical protein Q8900_08155 [Bacillota bacterium]|nr:hypothetical protein [Bacillota bacterium]
MINFKEELFKYKTIAITGMEKNTGKTTTLISLINMLKDYKLGLTSIGRDGEDKDVVTASDKPRIYINEGTLIATAKQCILKSDVTFEILNVMNINTPLGEIIIAKSLTGGFIELAGPSTKTGIKEVINIFDYIGAEKIIVDGALSRKSFASPEVTESCILCTGAEYSENINIISEETVHYVRMLSIEKIDESVEKLYKEVIESAKLDVRIAFIYKDSVVTGNSQTSIIAAKEVINSFNEGLKYIFIKGIVTDSFINDILNSSFQVNKVLFVVEDGTKLFVSNESYSRFLLKGGIIKAVKKINIIGISVNPKSVSGMEVDFEKLKSILENKINLPVFNGIKINLPEKVYE